MRILFILTALCLTATSLWAEVVVEPIDYQHDGVALRGYLAYDNAVADSRPGVLVVHEWWGCNDYARDRAKQLAELGYVAFACDMYGQDKTTTDGEQAAEWAGQLYSDRALHRSRVFAGYEVLRSSSKVADQPIAAIGYCFGGTTVLELACSNVEGLVGVVSFHGNPKAPLDTDPSMITPAILICHGAADPFVKPEELQAAIDGFEAHGADLTLKQYEGAVHSFTNPAADGSFNPGAMYHEEAANQSWQDMQDFFDRVFDRGE